MGPNQQLTVHLDLTIPNGAGPFPAIICGDLCWGKINPEIVAAYGQVYDRALAALYDGPYKLIATSRGERMLFDLAHDPGEDDDLATRQPERTAAMAERLEGLRPLGSPAAVARRE